MPGNAMYGGPDDKHVTNYITKLTKSSIISITNNNVCTLTNIRKRQIIAEMPITMKVILVGKLSLAAVTHRPSCHLESIRFLMELLLYYHIVCGVEVIVYSSTRCVCKLSSVLISEAIPASSHHHQHPALLVCQPLPFPGHSASTMLIAE